MAKAIIINELIEKMGMKMSAFETAIGAGNRTISTAIQRDGDISPKVIEKIVAKFPHVSKQWLMFGEGDMFTDSQPTKPTGDDLRNQKAFGKPEDDNDPGLIYVPISAQAGYTRNFTDPVYLTQLERLYIPGLPYKGDKYRYFDVEGDSMYPTLEDGMQVIGLNIEQEHWKHASNFYIHIIVTESQIMIKRLFRHNDTTLVLISDNEEMYPQVSIQWQDVRELWLVKRKLDWGMAPPKNYEIKIK